MSNHPMCNENEKIVGLRAEVERLRKELAEVREQLAAERQRRTELEQAKGSAPAPTEIAETPVVITEYEATLRRVVQRTAMIVQAEKCVIMVRDEETGDLVACKPAWGMTDEEVRRFRVPPDVGYSGEIYKTGKPAFLEDASASPRARLEQLHTYGVRNALSVPLILEKRDENNQIVDRVTVGVLHCFNKRFEDRFNEEDLRLLERLARNTAAVIANIQIYMQVVEEKQKLAHTIESLSAGILLISPDGRIAQMNAQARAIFQIPSHLDPIGKPYQEVIRNEQAIAILQRKMQELMNPSLPESDSTSIEERAQQNEITITDEDEDQYIYQVHAALVRESADKLIGTVFIFNDITDIRNIERMKTEFVSIVSHELRTPLTPMKGFIQMLIDGLEEGWLTKEEQREYYQIIQENVDRLSRMINDLLNVSRIERMGAAGIEMNWEITDLRKAAEVVVNTQKGRTDKHTLVIDFEPEHIEVETDPDKIQNILQNFVSNAIKYSEGGEVRIIARQEPPSKEFPQGSVRIGVKDQGIGLSEKEIKRIGEKFFRSDNKKVRAVGGTGIGLFLVKHLIARHGGYMWVESELGKGSTFWFRIPLRQPKQDEVAKAS
ncbi:ATP-binding protein [Chthonomonas calidirosea]|uniref:ATP-binding protein n=1 Tax=Chthonomonas calidirosea TaxID=454171 RepID=UPI0009491190|nr:ATP-binding protein [Chthonomonas calidirosea]